MEEETHFPDSDLDFSFTTTSSSSSTSVSDTLNDYSHLTTTSSPNHHHHRPHRKSEPHWSAINAVAPLHLHHLKLLRQVGSGNLGRVFLCRLHGDRRDFALKVVDTESLTPKKLSHVHTEALILSELDHPFLPTLYAQFEVSHYTCLLIDYCPGGDLHRLLRNQPRSRFPLNSVKFFAAEVLVALEYLHALGIVYRDLKPENILIREDGHIMLSDFDLCFKADVVPRLEKVSRLRRKSSKTRWWSCFRRREAEEPAMEFVAEPTAAFSSNGVGTHEYLAPELITGDGHGNGVDWWAFGVLVYELLHGTTPFKGGSKEDTLRRIASSRGARVNVSAEGMEEAKDLIERLLVKDPGSRLGCARGATDVKLHPFFNGIKWPLIRGYRPPEARGLVVKQEEGEWHVGHVTGVASSPKRSLWGWKKIGHFLKKSRKSR